jgi:diadenosine tetraphosphate (Ap4A) HIT family hydrolase
LSRVEGRPLSNVIAFHYGFPDTSGHSLIVPKRHISSFFEATREEQAALFDLLAEMQIMGFTEMAVYESCR